MVVEEEGIKILCNIWIISDIFMLLMQVLPHNAKVSFIAIHLTSFLKTEKITYHF